MMQRKTGSPDCAEMEGRLDKEKRCYALLERLGLEFERVDHEPAETMEACQKIEAALGAPICKNLFLCNRQQTVFYLYLTPGDKPFRTKDFSKVIGSARLSFGSAEHMERLLDITPGSVSVLGLMNDHGGEVSLVVDQELLGSEYVGIHPCINTSTLRLRTRDVLGPLADAMRHPVSVVEVPRDTDD